MNTSWYCTTYERLKVIRTNNLTAFILTSKAFYQIVCNTQNGIPLIVGSAVTNNELL